MNYLPALSPVPPGLMLSSESLRGARAARDFEACLIASLLESVQKTFAGLSGPDSLPGSDDYSYLGTRALAEAMAERGAFGIATLIQQHLQPHEGKGDGVPEGAADSPANSKVSPSPADRRR